MTKGIYGQNTRKMSAYGGHTRQLVSLTGAAGGLRGFRPWVYFAGNIRRHIFSLVLGGILCYNHRELLRKG